MTTLYPSNPDGGRREVSEVRRIRGEYAARDARGRPDLYAWYRPDVAATRYRFDIEVAHKLRLAGLSDLGPLQVLDVGCGVGSWLGRLMEWGLPGDGAHGVDLLPDRIARAKSLYPGADFRVVEGFDLPFLDNVMDLVGAHTVFSSILDSTLRTRLARELLRVVKPGGSILVFDYAVSDPRNPATVGITRREVHGLFPNTRIAVTRLVLAPPIARLLGRFSRWGPIVGEFVLWPLRTHRLYWISPRVAEDTASI